MADPTLTPTLNGIPNNPTSLPLTQATSRPEDPKKRKRASTLLSGITSKFSRKKSAPTPGISKEEIWRAMPNTVHPMAQRLGMNFFDFAQETTRPRVQERELSPGAVSHRRSPSPEQSLFDLTDYDDVSPGQSVPRDIEGRPFHEDAENDGDDERGRNRSGVSAYSDAARKRASGYVLRPSISSNSVKRISFSDSLSREPSYGSAQVATFTSAYPRQIVTTRNSDYSEMLSGGSVRSPISSVGSSIPRDGSSVWDRSSSRWDSTATDVTTPDEFPERFSKSWPSKSGMHPGYEDSDRTSMWPVLEHSTDKELFPGFTEDYGTPGSIPEEHFLWDRKGVLPSASEDDGASIDTTAGIRTLTPQYPPIAEQNNLEKTDLQWAPFVKSDLQCHQIRVQDFTLGTHVVHNAMDMADIPMPSPRKHRKSVFLEMQDDDEDWEDFRSSLAAKTLNGPAVSVIDEDAMEAVDEDVNREVEETLRGLSIAAVHGNTEYYTQRESTSSVSPALATVAEEETGSRVFGHKRSSEEDVLHSMTYDHCFGRLPLHEKAGEATDGESAWRPGHRRSRAVSLGRPKTIVVLPSTKMPGSYQAEDVELDEAMAEEVGESDGRSSEDFLDLGDGVAQEA